LEIFCQNIGFS